MRGLPMDPARGVPLRLPAFPEIDVILVGAPAKQIPFSLEEFCVSPQSGASGMVSPSAFLMARASTRTLETPRHLPNSMSSAFSVFSISIFSLFSTVSGSMETLVKFRSSLSCWWSAWPLVQSCRMPSPSGMQSFGTSPNAHDMLARGLSVR